MCKNDGWWNRKIQIKCLVCSSSSLHILNYPVSVACQLQSSHDVVNSGTVVTLYNFFSTARGLVLCLYLYLGSHFHKRKCRHSHSSQLLREASYKHISSLDLKQVYKLLVLCYFCELVFRHGQFPATLKSEAGVIPSWHTLGIRLSLKCDGTCAETRFLLSAKRTSPFKSAGGL